MKRNNIAFKINKEFEKLNRDPKQYSRQNRLNFTIHFLDKQDPKKTPLEADSQASIIDHLTNNPNGLSKMKFCQICNQKAEINC